jgi:Ca2+-transporting ATPase
MLKTIFTTAAFFVVVMMVLLAGMAWGHWFRGDGDMSKKFPELSVRQVSIFFTVYVLFQVWNQINSRSLTPQTNGFHGILNNRIFLAIVGTIVLVQVAITTIPPLADVFDVAPLGVVDWLVIAAFTSSVLGFAEVVRRIRLAQHAAPARVPA